MTMRAMQGVSRESLAAVMERLERPAADPGVDLLSLGAELFSVVGLLDREAALRRVLADPALAPEQKGGLAQALLAPHAGPATIELVEGAVRARWSRSRDLVDAVELVAIESVLAAAQRDERLEEVEDELFRFGRILRAEPALQAALAGRAMGDRLPADRKRALLDALLADRVHQATLLLVRQLVSQPRGRTLDDGLEEFSRLAAARRQRLIAYVEAVTPLDDERRRRLAAALKAAYGQAVRLNVEVVPDVLGGLRIRIGDEVIDGTVAHRLAAARRRLAGT
jgi:F-type H+-transporting ATPase subunit delta